MFYHGSLLEDVLSPCVIFNGPGRSKQAVTGDRNEHKTVTSSFVTGNTQKQVRWADVPQPCGMSYSTPSTKENMSQETVMPVSRTDRLYVWSAIKLLIEQCCEFYNAAVLNQLHGGLPRMVSVEYIYIRIYVHMRTHACKHVYMYVKATWDRFTHKITLNECNHWTLHAQIYTYLSREFVGL